MPKLSGSEIIVEYLIKEGVPYVAGLPGTGRLRLWTGCGVEATGLKP